MIEQTDKSVKTVKMTIYGRENDIGEIISEIFDIVGKKY